MHKPIAISLALMVLLPACQRTLVFTEQAAFKLGIEVNDDPTTPVDVTAGLKRSVVSVTPPREPLVEAEGGGSRAEGEAVSTLAWFDLAYEPADSPFTGTLTIRTSFASGLAAIAKVVGVPLVGVATPELQARREKAADFVKSLEPEQLDQLATQLGLQPGPQALGDILVAIAQANTTESFKVIAQAIELLFGEEV
jgi:hypothetical protein